MGKLFSSIGRLFRAMLYTLAGDTSKWSEVWESTTGFINAEYEDIERDVAKDANDAADAYAEMKVVVNEKQKTLERLGGEIEKLKKQMVGAKAAGQKRTQALKAQGKTNEEIKQDVEILRCLEFYENFKSTLEAKEQESQRLDEELDKDTQKLAKVLAFVEKQSLELKKIRQEKAETIADHRIADAENRINAMLTGIGDTQGSIAERRRRQQELRMKRRAKADALSEITGARKSDAEEEFLTYANNTIASSEFFTDMGIDEESPKETKEEMPLIPE